MGQHGRTAQLLNVGWPGVPQLCADAALSHCLKVWQMVKLTVLKQGFETVTAVRALIPSPMPWQSFCRGSRIANLF